MVACMLQVKAPNYHSIYRFLTPELKLMAQVLGRTKSRFLVLRAKT
jgi:hypothetical protein